LNNQSATRISSPLALAVAMALMASNAAYADSAHEWGYWDAAPPVQQHDVTTLASNGYTNVTAEQTHMAINAGELVTASAVDAPWIGYVAVSGSDSNVAVIHLTPEKQSGVNTGKLSVTSDVAAFNMSFNSANNESTTSPSFISNSHFGFSGAEGEFNSNNYQRTVTNSTLKETDVGINALGDILNNESEGQYFASVDIHNELTTYDGYNAGTNSYSTSSSNIVEGTGYIGKVMPLADIASQARLNANYNFYGSSSRNMRMPVVINVNFGTGTWTGTWSSVSSRFPVDSFNAAGNITGANLNSTSVLGLAGTESSAKYVQSGVVTGTMIGVMNNGAHSDAGIIGGTELNVGAAGTATHKVVGTFKAMIGRSLE
jgi:hypothetical protein